MSKAIAILCVGAVCASLSSCSRFTSSTRDYDDYVGPLRAGSKPTPLPGIRTPEHAPVPPGFPRTGPVELTIEEAVLLVLENNQSFRVQRLNPSISSTFVDEARSAFDPTLTGDISAGKTRSRLPGAATTSAGETISGGVGVTQFLPAGTTLGLTATGQDTESSPGNNSGTARAGLSITQSLLRGAGATVNLAELRQARIDAEVSEYELRAFAEALVAQVEETYWDYLLAERNIAIFSDSAKLAEQQLSETQERIREGALAETELASAEAELALRQEDLINARSELAQTRLRLLRLLNPPGPDRWVRNIVLKNQPTLPGPQIGDVESDVAIGLRMRPDLNQARLGVKRNDLQVVKTKNGLLPKLDAFINLGKTGYSSSFEHAVSDIDGRGYDWQVGLMLQYPIGDRGATARYRRAMFNREQAMEAVNNLAQLVQVDVRSAYIEVNRAKEQISATAATRRRQEEKVRSETEKFRVGRSTSLLVAQAQRDLLQSQIAEVRAVTNYCKSLVEFYRLEGSLLERRGITAPGREPVELPKELEPSASLSPISSPSQPQ